MDGRDTMKPEYFNRFLEHFGRMVASERKKRGLSQEGLAELTELHRNSINKIEHGLDNMFIDTISNIYLALGVQQVSLDYIAGRMEHSTTNSGIKPFRDKFMYQKMGIMLETLRKEQDISRERLSNRLNIHRNTIARIENGMTEVRFTTLLTLYRYFGICEVKAMPPESLQADTTTAYGFEIRLKDREDGFNLLMQYSPAE